MADEAACEPDEGLASIGPNCLFLDMDPEHLGVPDDPQYLDLYSTELTVPVRAGEAYAFSFRYTGGAHTFELWGSTAHSVSDFTCGMATELLVSREIPGDGTYCLDFVATQDHTHWLEVIRGGQGGGQRTDFHYCPAVTCP